MISNQSAYWDCTKGPGVEINGGSNDA